MEIICSTFEEWNFPQEETFDLVVSRLVIHYVEDKEALFKRVYGCLKKGGKFVFSVEHPFMVASRKVKRLPPATGSDWMFDSYFVTGKRKNSWFHFNVERFHSTIEDYFTALVKAGFAVEFLRESKPEEKNFEDRSKCEYYLHRPLFLMFSAKKL